MIAQQTRIAGRRSELAQKKPLPAGAADRGARARQMSCEQVSLSGMGGERVASVTRLPSIQILDDAVGVGGERVVARDGGDDLAFEAGREALVDGEVFAPGRRSSRRCSVGPDVVDGAVRPRLEPYAGVVAGEWTEGEVGAEQACAAPLRHRIKRRCVGIEP